jgi:predicted N-formylglutamate amidohydrolase
VQLLITCEHGGNTVPASYRHLFRDGHDVLRTHRGYDPGALQLARRLSHALSAPLIFSTTSRLLVELNRTLGHPRLFSEFSRHLPETTRKKLVDAHYTPYRKAVTDEISRLARRSPVVHLSIHTFTPVMKERVRRTEIGLLFDPARRFETQLCQAWRRELRTELPLHTIHFNLPYRGTSDGFTVALRKQFPDACYAGIELEVNQKFPLGPSSAWRRLQQGIINSLEKILPELSASLQR